MKEFGCNPDHKDKKGITPKTLAMINGHTGVVKLFGGSGIAPPVSCLCVCVCVCVCVCDV